MTIPQHRQSALSSQSERQHTVHQRIWSSQYGQAIIKDKELAGFGLLGTTLVGCGLASINSDIEHFMYHAILPVAGLAISTLGIAALQDARINDWNKHQAIALTKIVPNTFITLGGIECFAKPLNIPIFKSALSRPLELTYNQYDLLAGFALILGSVVLGKNAFKQPPSNSNTGSVKAFSQSAALGTAAMCSVLGGVELIARHFNSPYCQQALTGTLKAMSRSEFSMGVGAGLLFAAALTCGKIAVNNGTRQGNEFITAALTMSSVTSGLGALEMGGRTLGLPQAQEIFWNNTHRLSGACLALLGAALGMSAKDRIAQHGFSGRRSGEFSLAFPLITQGLSMGTKDIAKDFAEGSHQTGLGLFGIGLAATTLGFMKQSLEAIREKKYEAGFLHTLLAVLSTNLSVYSLDEATNLPIFSKASKQLDHYVNDPLWDHVLTPLTDFMLKKPIISGLSLTALVSALFWSRLPAEKDNEGTVSTQQPPQLHDHTEDPAEHHAQYHPHTD